MPNKDDITRLRKSASDDVIFGNFYTQDAGFKAAVDRVKAANPTMGALEEANFSKAMLNIYYKVPAKPPSNPLTTQMAAQLGESAAIPAPAPVSTQPQGFFDKYVKPVAQGINDYATAPGEAMVGGIMKGISQIPGMDFAGNHPSVQNLSKNLRTTADVARVGVPIAAGLATGGLSIPATMAVSGVAGMAGSATASGLEAASGERQTLGGAATEAVTMGAANAILDGATMGLFRLASPLLKAKGLTQLTDEAAKKTGQIVQGTGKEIEQGRKALQAVDTTGVSTYADLAKTMEQKIGSLIGQQDQLLDTMPARYTIDQLTTTVNAGGKTAKDNFVKAALDGLSELYAKTGNTEGLLKLQALKEAAEDPLRGLTVRQVNDLAREYGRGFRAFSDATGQPLTSTNAKLYETVRKGLKTVSRNLMPNEASKIIDEEMSNLIQTHGLVQDMAEKVQTLTNKVGMRHMGEQIGSFIGKVVNLSSFGTIGGFLRGITPSNQGLKTLNSLQIEKHLSKNLRQLDSLLKQIDSLPDTELLRALKNIFGNVVEKTTNSAVQSVPGAAINALNNAANDQR